MPVPRPERENRPRNIAAFDLMTMQDIQDVANTWRFDDQDESTFIGGGALEEIPRQGNTYRAAQFHIGLENGGAISIAGQEGEKLIDVARMAMKLMFERRLRNGS